MEVCFKLHNFKNYSAYNLVYKLLEIVIYATSRQSTLFSMGEKCWCSKVAEFVNFIELKN